jgi:hypothetical protein
MHACNYDAFRCFLPLFWRFFFFPATHKSPEKFGSEMGKSEERRKKKAKDQIITQGDSQAFSDDAHHQFVVISIRFSLLCFS